MFREPEKRPPAIVSNLFTLLVILPFVIFLGLTLKLGMSFSSGTFSLSALAFHLSMGGKYKTIKDNLGLKSRINVDSIAAIYGLFLCFWLYLNMFQTLKWLAILAVPAFITGHSMLTSIAAKRTKPAAPSTAAK